MSTKSTGSNDPNLHVLRRDAEGRFIGRAKAVLQREGVEEFTFAIDPDLCDEDMEVLQEFRGLLPPRLKVEDELPLLVLKVPFIDPNLAQSGRCKCECKCNFQDTCGGGGGGGGAPGNITSGGGGRD
jgi:hypothetical protein